MKKLLVAMLMFGTVLFGAQGVATADEITPRAMSVPCPECGLMVIESPIRVRTDTYTEACSHGKNGYDRVTVTYTQYALSCQNHYYETYERKTSTSVTCLGK